MEDSLNTDGTGSGTALDAVREAVTRGFVPIPIRSAPPGRRKTPLENGWTHTRWESVEAAVAAFEGFAADLENPASNVGLLLGAPSGGLVDIDLDHPRTRRLADYFLPNTPMRSGRPGNPRSHYWYLCEPGTLQGYRKYTMPKTPDGKAGETILEYRSTGGQSVIPPSLHTSGEPYRWEGAAWGGADGPTRVNGKVLQTQAALLALGTLLIDVWPPSGAGMRHEAHLALAGGLLRLGEGQVHPYWRRNAPVLIRALADATDDSDGAEAREKEVMATTVRRILAGQKVTGFGKLGEIIGEKAVDQVRILLGEVEASAGLSSRQAMRAEGPPREPRMAPRETEYGTEYDDDREHSEEDDEQFGSMADERDPMEERVTTWQRIDLEPYLLGQVNPVQPSVFRRTDDQALMYPGRVNMLFGSSESAKSWIMLEVCRQEIASNGRALYVDFEDEPVETLARLFALGSSPDDLRGNSFSYIRPEAPMADMQRNRWGKDESTDEGMANYAAFQQALEETEPTLIVLDGMTVLYGLHGLDTNDSTSTDVITSWLKSLTANGRRTVVVIDHTGKAPERGSLPIGSQHKQAMVQGSMIQAWMVDQPMPGAKGQVELIVVKDRPGHVRKASVKSGKKAQLAAVVIIDSLPEEQRPALKRGERARSATVLSILAPGDVPEPPKKDQNTIVVNLEESRAAMKYEQDTAIEDQIMATFGDDLSLVQTFEDVMLSIPRWPNKDKKVREGLSRLVDRGWLERWKERGPSWHYRQTERGMSRDEPGDGGAVRPSDASEEPGGVVVPDEPQEPQDAALADAGVTFLPPALPPDEPPAPPEVVEAFVAYWETLDEQDEHGRVPRLALSAQRFDVTVPMIQHWLRQARAEGLLPPS